MLALRRAWLVASRRGAAIGLASRFIGRCVSTIRIDDIVAPCGRDPDDPASGLIPSFYAPPDISSVMLAHLRWMLQKDRILHQDMMLIGPPGPQRRRIALAYAQLACREVEFVTITPDTTEADLKQRREIRSGSMEHSDQAPVRAAISGALLIVEGLERAERNVLPILNNLLENREMALEDGRFLCSPQRWRALLASGATENELAKQRLIPVHPDFRVCAICLPVPPYRGRALDPPLRSRFSARYIQLEDISAATRVDGSVGHGEERPSVLASRLIAAVLTLRNASANLSQSPTTDVDVTVSALRMGMNEQAVAQVDTPALSAALLQLRFLPGLSARVLPGLLHRMLPYWFLAEYASSRSRSHTPLSTTGPSDKPGTSATSVLGLSGALSSVLASLARLDDSVSVGAPDAFTVQKVFSTSSRGWEGAVAMAPASLAGTAFGMEKVAWSPLPVALGELAHADWMWNSKSDVKGSRFRATLPLEAVMGAMVVSHATGRDMVIVGPQACGKSELVREFCHRLGYRTVIIPLFSDMSQRDLLQRRTVDEFGNSGWAVGPLVEAAQAGHVVVLDGLERLFGDTLASLSRLCYDRDVDLPDGSRLLHHERYDKLAVSYANSAQSDRMLIDGRITLRVHPSFRIMAIASTSAVSSWAAAASQVTTQLSSTPRQPVPSMLPSDESSFCHPEVCGMFDYHVYPAHSVEETIQILQFRFPAVPQPVLKALTQTAADLRSIADVEFASDPAIALSLRLSLKQLIRASQHLSAVSRMEDWLSTCADQVRELSYYASLPMAGRSAIDAALHRHGLSSQPRDRMHIDTSSPVNIAIEGHEAGRTSVVFSGGARNSHVRLPLGVGVDPALVPHTLYVPIPQHQERILRLAADIAAGSKFLLLLGNQGAGKNKLVDHLLQVVKWEREYLQLHRDSTIASLTLAPSLKHGVIRWEDSALVRAARLGRVLVVDELDKAPNEVTAVFKGLIDDGELLLGDGRRILSASAAHALGLKESPSVIISHPRFMIWALANRPGWPFLGNSIFRSGLSTSFSVHWIENPDANSESMLLQAYAPEVDPIITRAMADAFAELRKLHEAATISYPFSSREAVAAMRHLASFHNDSLSDSLENLLSFDSHDEHTRRRIAAVFRRHGICMNDSPLSSTSNRRSRFSSFRVVSCESSGAPSPHRVIPQRPASVKCEVIVSEVRLVLRELHDHASSSSGLFELLAPRMMGEFTNLRSLWSLQPPDGSTERTVSTSYAQRAGGSLGAISLGGDLGSNSVRYGGMLPSTVHIFSGLAVSATAGVLSLAHVMGLPPRRHYECIHLHGLYEHFRSGGLWGMPGFTARVSPEASLSSRLGLRTHSSRSPRPAENNPVMGFLGRSGHAIIVEPDLGAIIILPIGRSKVALALPIPRAADDARPRDVHSMWSLSPQPHCDAFMMWRPGTSTAYVIEIDVESAKAQVSTASSPSPLGAFAVPLVSADLLSVRWQFPPLQTHPSPTKVALTLELSRTPIHARWIVGSDLVVSPSHQRPIVHSDGRRLVFSSIDGDCLKTIDVDSLVSVGEGTNKATERDASPIIGVHETGDVQSGVVIASANGRVCIAQLDPVALTTQAKLWGRVLGVAVSDGPSGLPLVESSYPSTSPSESPVAYVNQLGQSKIPLLQMLPHIGAARRPPPTASSPKHGKVDPKNTPHTGGNTWAGGTGGSDTAGLGGRGGPYRLDAGHHVTQVDEAEKMDVSDEARRAAKAMAQEAYAARLAELRMSPEAVAMYSRYSDAVSEHVGRLRAVLASAQSDAAERTWLTHQTYGDLDDRLLVDGISGDPAVFKRRGVADAPHFGERGAAKPRLLVFAFDCSASMYRFNSADGRLTRACELAALLMDGLAGFERHFRYSMAAHSGDGEWDLLVDANSPPLTPRDRLEVIGRMIALSQYCSSGDTTVLAAARAVEEASAGAGLPAGTLDDRTERFVFLLSDANFQRYGISPVVLGKALSADPLVRSHALFLSPGLPRRFDSRPSEASAVTEAMPPGMAHIVLDPSTLPTLLRGMLTAKVSTRY